MMTTSRILLAASFVVAFALSAAAQAHPRLLTTSPRTNSSVVRLNKIQLSFSEKLIGPMTGADVLMTGMPGTTSHQSMKVGGITSTLGVDGKTLTLLSSRPLSPGTYQIVWHAVSVDTHRVKGSFTFKVK